MGQERSLQHFSAFMATEGYLVMTPIQRRYGKGQVIASILNSWESILGNKTWSSNLKPDQAGRGSRPTCREGEKKSDSSLDVVASS